MRPTLEKLHSDFCQAATFAASAGALAGFAFRHRARKSSSSSDGFFREARPQDSEILCVQLVIAGSGVDRFAAGHNRVAFDERRGQIFFNRQVAALIRVEHDALQVHLLPPPASVNWP